MPKPKTFHSTNPSDMAKWSHMRDDADFYIILSEGVTTTASLRKYEVKYREEMVWRNEGKPGDLLYKGACVPAKAFGPGVDLQRLVDLGAIREATPWEVEEVLNDFATDAARAGALAGVNTEESRPEPVIAGRDAKAERVERHARTDAK